MCTIIPLTTKRMNDTRWYHIDLEKQESTALIEQLRNISKLRIPNPQRIKGKLNRISQFDMDKIDAALKNYYRIQKIPKK